MVNRRKVCRVLLLGGMCAALMTGWAQGREGGPSDRSLIVVDPPRAVPEIDIRDADDRPAPLSDLLGRVVVLNLWASWCAPCLAELPALDRLAVTYDEQGIAVVALSLDRGGAAAVSQTYARLSIHNLAVRVDPRRGAALAASSLPLTIFLNRQGQEIARISGAVQWDDPALYAVLKALAQGQPVAQGQSLPPLEP